MFEHLDVEMSKHLDVTQLTMDAYDRWRCVAARFGCRESRSGTVS